MRHTCLAAAQAAPEGQSADLDAAYLVDAVNGTMNLRFLEDLFREFAALEGEYYTVLTV